MMFVQTVLRVPFLVVPDVEGASHFSLFMYTSFYRRSSSFLLVFSLTISYLNTLSSYANLVIAITGTIGVLVSLYNAFSHRPPSPPPSFCYDASQPDVLLSIADFTAMKTSPPLYLIIDVH